MSRTDTWMPLYIGDYLADTRRLTTVEHGAYLLLLMEQWRIGWLPDDDQQLARITGMRLDHWRKVARNLRSYFDHGERPGTIQQKRLHAERERAMEISAKRADAARAKAEAGKAKGGGGSGAKSAHVSTPDFEANPLKNGHVKAANAEQVQPISTPQLQSQLERKTGTPFSPPTRQAERPAEKTPLPEWMPSAWGEWETYRRTVAPRTWNEQVRRFSIASLEALRRDGHDPAAVIHQAIAGGFTAFRALPIAASPRRETVGAYFARQRAAGLLEADDFADLDEPTLRRLQ